MIKEFSKTLTVDEKTFLDQYRSGVRVTSQRQTLEDEMEERRLQKKRDAVIEDKIEECEVA